MNKIKYIVFIIFAFLFMTNVSADNMYNIDMDIYLNKDGSAKIKEVWDVKADSGTEWYKALYNMGNMEISDFNVTMDGKTLKSKSWDVDETLNEKAGYFGINYVSEGIELCFGKSDFNRHTFTLTYNLSNVIFKTSDADVLYNTLFPNVTLDNFNVNVTSFYSFPDSLDVWGFGYKGYAYVKDGKISMSNEGSLNDDYVVLLAKFPLDTFDTNNSYDEFTSFDDVLNMANEGTYKYDYEYDDGNSFNIFNLFITLFEFFIALGLPILVLIININKSKNKYGYLGNKKITKDNTNMFRDIPCNKDIYYANTLLYLNSFNYKETNIFGAVILKWVKENKIRFKTIEKGIFNKETSTIDLTMNPSFDNVNEEKLFSIMFEASKDGILEPKEFEKWARKNYSEFYDVLEDFKDDVLSALRTSGHVRPRVNKEEGKAKNILSEDIYNDSKALFGLKLYLEEFSRINTKEVMEVKLWDQYLMFAYLFGIADKVSKQLKNLYPEALNDPNYYYDYNTILFINSFSNSTVHAASAARSAAESYSGGGGGFSIGGGGGGSFGGGGSMGGR